MTKEYTDNLEDMITHGFETIDGNAKVEVNLKDLMYVYSTLLEYQCYFHQPSHYKTIEDVERFLGSVNDKAGYKILHKSIHEKMEKMIPKELKEKYGEGDFDSPRLPFYFDAER